MAPQKRDDDAPQPWIYDCRLPMGGRPHSEVGNADLLTRKDNLGTHSCSFTLPCTVRLNEQQKLARPRRGRTTPLNDDADAQ